MRLNSFSCETWVEPGAALAEIRSPIDQALVGLVSSAGVDFAAMADHARMVGGPGLRALTFRVRAERLKQLAAYLNDRREGLHRLSLLTGATRRDGMIDIEGGIGTLFSLASKGRRELPDEHFLVDGAVERLSKGGSFAGLHIMTPLNGIAVHINAFNFPVWGMLEKLGPALLAGVPMIIKPATSTAYVAAAAFRLIVESGLLPPGAVQLVVGGVGDLFNHLTGQDLVLFTGSAGTSTKLRNHPVISANAVRFVAERDSLNAAILGSDAGPGSPEFDLFVKEVAREMTVKAGQKCTAIRRVLAPAAWTGAVVEALSARLARTVVGDPRRDEVTMGPVVSLAQQRDCRDRIAVLQGEARVVYGDPARPAVAAGDPEKGAFLSPVLLQCDDPAAATRIHDVEVFGPVSTVLPYRDPAEAIALVRRGEGSLVASLYTYDAGEAARLVSGIAPYHGRLILIDRDCAKESTGHGSPLPVLVHGGPGRAGGGEELGGMRGVHHYLQRTALQGSPGRLAALTKAYVKGAAETAPPAHPFTIPFERLAVGDTIVTPEREVTLADIEHFADFTGDRFYAHMDEAAAAANPFFPGRVAHGYLLLSFAAGLFVDPAPGPVLANYGLDSLRFLKPVTPGETIKVRLTVKQKNPRNAEYGEVRWDVELTNGAGETVATYDLLTMNALAVAA